MLFVTVLACSLGLYAQTHHKEVVHLTVTDGLASGNIQNITEDQQGFIWIATENGLSRYDQYNCINFEEKNNSTYGLSHNFVHDVVPNQNYGVWVGTISGLDKYNPANGDFATYHIYSQDKQALSKPIMQIKPLTNGSCFLRTNSKYIYIYSHTQDSIIPLSYSGFMPKTIPSYIAHYNTNSILVGDKKGHLYTINPNGKSRLIDSLEHEISALLQIDSTTFIVADITGTLHTYKHEKRHRSFSFPLQYHTRSEKRVSTLTRIHDTLLYVGTHGAGVFSFSPAKGWINEAASSSSLINKNISDIFVDSQKNIWIGHAYGGASIIKDNQPIVYLNIPKTIQNNKISALKSDNNTLWIGTENDGLYIYDIGSKSYNHYNAHIPIGGKEFDNQITAIHADESIIWVGTYNKGVFAISKEDNSLVYYAELQNIPVREISSIYTDSKQRVWIGTYDKGVYVFSPHTGRIIDHYSTRTNPKISTNGITGFFEDSKNNIWIGGYYGISKISPDNSISIYTENTHPGLQNNVISHIQEDFNNTIWISTLQGISYYSQKNDSIIPLSIPVSDFKHAVIATFPIEKNVIACVTLRNLYIYNTQHKTIAYIGSCPFGEFSPHAYSYNSNSALLGTQNGIVQAFIDTSFFSKNTKEHLALSDMQVNGVSVFSEKSEYSATFTDGVYSITLPYHEDNITFKISDFLQTHKTNSHFSFTLEGFDTKWHTISQDNTIRYTNLPGGDYTLRVKKRNPSGLSENELHIHVSIQKAIWETTLFYIILLIIAIAIGYAIYTSRMHKVIMARNKLQKQIEKRTKDLLKQKEKITEQKERIQKQRDDAHKKNAEMAGLLEEKEELESSYKQLENDLEKIEENNETLKEEYETIQKQYNTIIHFSKEMIFRISLPSENFEYISPACEKLTGYTPEEFYSDKNIFKNLFDSKDKDKFKKFRKYMIEGKVPPLMEYKIITKNGTRKWVAQHSIIIRDNNKNPIAYEAMIIEITEFKKIQKQKEASIQRKKDVEQLYSHVTDEENDTSQSTFKLFSKILNKPGISFNEKQASLEEKNQDTTSLQMIDDIIDIYKIESDELDLNNSQCYINTLLQDLHDSFNELKKNNNKNHVILTLDIPIEGENFSFYTDTYRLRQILMNLLGNAFKFTKQGEIRFGYTLVEDPATENDEEIVFFVQDTGVGISKEQMPFIFERFKSHNGKFGFSGVGLYLSNKLVELLGGRMWVESVIDTGTIFQFSLPIKKMKGLKKATSTLPNNTTISEIDWSQKTLLLAEDEQDNYDYVKEILKKTNMSVIWVRNGEDAINTFKKYHRDIDIILMDIQMPKINGYEATQEIKDIDSNVPIIAQTAYANSEAKINCFDAGCDHYLAKPYKARDLIETIRKHL
ncbi:MAG: two-component regulator propeller domain-containing protein [Bacteroidales bacterium]